MERMNDFRLGTFPLSIHSASVAAATFHSADLSIGASSAALGKLSPTRLDRTIITLRSGINDDSVKPVGLLFLSLPPPHVGSARLIERERKEKKRFKKFICSRAPLVFSAAA